MKNILLHSPSVQATPPLRIVNYIFIIVHFGDKFINNLRTGETYQRNDLCAPHLLRLCLFNEDNTVRSRMRLKFGIGKLFTMFVKVCSLHSCFIFHEDLNRWGRIIEGRLLNDLKCSGWSDVVVCFVVS